MSAKCCSKNSTMRGYRNRVFVRNIQGVVYTRCVCSLVLFQDCDRVLFIHLCHRFDAVLKWERIHGPRTTGKAGPDCKPGKVEARPCQSWTGLPRSDRLWPLNSSKPPLIDKQGVVITCGNMQAERCRRWVKLLEQRRLRVNY